MSAVRSMSKTKYIVNVAEGGEEAAFRLLLSNRRKATGVSPQTGYHLYTRGKAYSLYRLVNGYAIYEL